MTASMGYAASVSLGILTPTNTLAHSTTGHSPSSFDVAVAVVICTSVGAGRPSVQPHTEGVLLRDGGDGSRAEGMDRHRLERLRLPADPPPGLAQRVPFPPPTPPLVVQLRPHDSQLSLVCFSFVLAAVLRSWGYHGDDGRKFGESGTGEPFGPSYTTGDVIGVGLHHQRKELFFTKNGFFLGRPLQHTQRNAKQRTRCDQ